MTTQTQPLFNLDLPANYQNSSFVGRMSCDRATVNSINNKLVTYYDLRQGLKASREEFTRAEKWEDTANAGLMALRWTKASCDAFISMAASASSALLPKKTADIAALIKGTYTATAVVAEAGSISFHGGRVDKLALIRDVKDGMSDVAGVVYEDTQLGKVSGIANLYVNIGIDAVRGDKSTLLIQATAGQFSEIAKLAAELATENKAGKLTKGYAAVVDIAIAGEKFGKELDAAADAYLDTQSEFASRRRSMHRMLASQLNRIEDRIQELERTLDACVCPETSKT